MPHEDAAALAIATETINKLSSRLELVSRNFARAIAVVDNVQAKQNKRIDALEQTTRDLCRQVSTVAVSNTNTAADVERLRRYHQECVIYGARDVLAVEVEVGGLRENAKFVMKSLNAIRSDVDGALSQALNDATSLRLECHDNGLKNTELSSRLQHAISDNDHLRTTVKSTEDCLHEVATEHDNLIKTIREQINCGICWAILKEPVTMECGHTLCQGCVAEWHEKTGTCPFCRRNASMPVAANCVLKNVVRNIQEAVTKRQRVKLMGDNDGQEAFAMHQRELERIRACDDFMPAQIE